MYTYIAAIILIAVLLLCMQHYPIKKTFLLYIYATVSGQGQPEVLEDLKCHFIHIFDKYHSLITNIFSLVLINHIYEYEVFFLGCICSWIQLKFIGRSSDVLIHFAFHRLFCLLYTRLKVTFWGYPDMQTVPNFQFWCEIDYRPRQPISEIIKFLWCRMQAVFVFIVFLNNSFCLFVHKA